MAQQRTRKVWTTATLRGNKFTDSTFDITYNSNRESGQIVKRESPLEMRKSRYIQMNGYAPFGGNAPIQGVFGYPGQNFVPTSSVAYLKAYRKMQKALNQPRAEILLNIVEGRKSLEMIAARATQLSNLVRSARKGRFGDAWTYLTTHPNETLKSMASGRARDSRFVTGKAREKRIDLDRRQRQLHKDVAALILEIRYGWSPLMQDIQSACEVLGKLDIKPVQIRERGTVKYTVRSVNSGGSPSLSTTLEVQERVTLKCTIAVSDPHLLLANSLGFVNLASLAWESTPFSFVFDWALPIGAWLQGFSDFVGLSVKEGSITGRITTYGDVIGSSWAVGPGQNAILGKAIDVRVTRKVGMTSLPNPPLTWGRGLSPGRAVNAIALLGALFINPNVATKIER